MSWNTQYLPGSRSAHGCRRSKVQDCTEHRTRASRRGRDGISERALKTGQQSTRNYGRGSLVAPRELPSISIHAWWGEMTGQRPGGLPKPCLGEEFSEQFGTRGPERHNHAGQPPSPVELLAQGRVSCHRSQDLRFIHHDPNVVVVGHGGEDLLPHSI